MIILFFGQPASGKTTLANALKKKISDIFSHLVVKSKWDLPLSFKKFSSHSIMIDGDRWRDITKNKDYSKEGRLRNLKGAFYMALYLEKEGYIPILSFVTPYDELRQYLKDNASNFVEIYLEYNEDRGRNKNFAQDFEVPTIDCLKLNTTKEDIEICLTKTINYIKENGKLE